MIHANKLFVVTALSIGTLLTGTTFAQSPAVDNTATNKQDRNAAEPTADQAKNNTSDRETMRRIRRSVMDDKSLSTYGHNVKIIAQHGKVTLRGPVRTEEEKKTIEMKATEIAGSGNVTNQITVKGDSK